MRTIAVVAKRFDTQFDQLTRDVLAAKAAAPFERIIIVVPGRALLRRVRRELGDVAGRALLGVSVVSLAGLAARLTPDLADQVVGSEVHQLLLSTLEPPEALRGIERVEPLLHATFRDLHDAGFGPEHLEAATELLAKDPWWRSGHDVLSAFASWRRASEAHGLIDRSDRVREAVRRMEMGAGLDAERVFWFGIYDLTGVMADLVRVVCRSHAGRFYFPDYAPETVSAPVPETPDQYLKDVFESVIAGATGERVVLAEDDEETAATLALFDASGERGELLEVARRIRMWADAQGSEIPWHRVAVIARELSGYAAHVRRIFNRYRIPFVLAKPVPAATHARVRGLLAACDLAAEGLLRSRFVDAIRFGGAAARAPFRGALGPLDGALRQFGVVEHDDWPLLLEHLEQGRPLRVPVRHVERDGGRGETPEVDSAVCAFVAGQVKALREVLDGWPERADCAVHGERWLALVSGLNGDVELAGQASAALEKTPVEVTRAAWVEALTRVVGGLAPEEKHGDGVLLLDVMSARGMVFDHAYLIGVNRRRWPRAIREDALLPDRIRRQMRVDLGLDALPVKERGHAEEALLFGHACSSARSTLTVSWQRSDAAGKALVASPFVEALIERAHVVSSIPRRRYDSLLPHVRALRVSALPLADLAWWTAVRRREDGRIPLLRLSIDPVRKVLLTAGLTSVAGRDALTTEPGPWDGMVGPPSGARGTLTPTRLQELLRCPWQFFVTRELGVAAVETRGELPSVDYLRLGSVVHTVHERLVGWLAPALAEQEDGETDELLWEDAEELARRWTGEVLRADLSAEPLLAKTNEAILMPRLVTRIDAVLAVLKAVVAGGRRPVEAERTLRGAVRLADGREVELLARADRVDAGQGGRAVADLKTGKPAKTDKDLLVQMARGRWMQAPLYHWLAPDAEWAGYEHVLDGGAVVVRGLTRGEFERVEPGLRQLLAAAIDLIDGGRYPHRTGMHCDFCPVTATCSRQHYPANRRQRGLADVPESALSADSAAVARYLDVGNRGVKLK